MGLCPRFYVGGVHNVSTDLDLEVRYVKCDCVSEREKTKRDTNATRELMVFPLYGG